jgi:hypothetical protein
MRSATGFGSRAAGIAALLAGLLWAPSSAAWLFAPDGTIESPGYRLAVRVGQAGFFLAGAWLLLAGRRLAPALARGLLAAMSLAAAIGAYAAGGSWSRGPARSEAVAEPVAETAFEPVALEDLCAWIREADDVPLLGDGGLDELLVELEELSAAPDSDPKRVVALAERVSQNLLRLGRVEEGIAHLERAMELAQGEGAPPHWINRLRRQLGVAHMRLGELDHCISMHNPESCLFPLSKDGVWADPAGALRAIEYFEASLASAPGDPGVRWLLNVAHMAAGSWPDGVRAEDRIEPRRGDPGPLGRFRDVALEVGMDANNIVGGAILDDFDGDGLLDVITSSFDPCDERPLLYYHNDGNGRFSERAEQAGLGGQPGGFNLVQADYDGDGRLDVLVLRGAWLGRRYGRQPNSLLRQNADGTFTDVSLASGIGRSAYPTLTAAWADYDRDGDLDLCVPHEGFAAELFRNEGDGTFTEVAAAAGIENTGMAKGVDWGDVDNDGDPDLYVSNWGQPNKLFRNRGDGTFEEAAVALGAEQPDEPALGGDGEPAEGMSGGADRHRTFTTWFWDYDGDGWQDLFVAGFGAKLDTYAADYLGLPAQGARTRLYRNLGGRFEDVGPAVGLARIGLPMAGNFGDLDNDGFPELYLGTGQPYFESLVPNELYRNVGGRRFEDVSSACGVGHLQKGHAVAFGDVDNDGDLDIYAQMGGAYPDDRFYDSLFLNPGTPNHWITLRLAGAGANRFAVGARIRVDVEERGAIRSVHAEVSSGGSFGCSSLEQELGLGAAERILAVEVRWPASGLVQRFTDPPLDSFVELTEGAEGHRVLERPRVPLAPTDRGR